MPVISTDPRIDVRHDIAAAPEASLFVDALRFSRLVLLLGAPGSGKTTLLRDRVKPALESETCHVVYFDRWNAAPLHALDACITKALPEATLQRADTQALRQGPWTDRLAAWTSGPGERLVILLDHFDRYLAANPGDGIEAFAREWAAALAVPSLPVQFVVGLRLAAEPILMARFQERISFVGDNRIVLPAPGRPRPDAPPVTVAPTVAPVAPAKPVAGAAAAAVPIAVHGLNALDHPMPADATVAPSAPSAPSVPSEPSESVQAEPGRASAPGDASRVVIAPAVETRPSPRTARMTAGAPSRSEPWLDPAAVAGRAATPPPGPFSAPDRADGFDDDDDLFGPEPTPAELQAALAARRRPWTLRLLRAAGLGIAVGAAVLVSAILFLPRDDGRLPQRARAGVAPPSPAADKAESHAPARAPDPIAAVTSSAPPRNAASSATTGPAPTPSAPAAGGQPPAARPAPAQPAPAPSAGVPSTGPAPQQRPPTVAAATLPPPRAGLAIPRAPADAMPRALSAPLEPDAAITMARDVGAVLASVGAPVPGVLPGIAAGTSSASSLFVARYDVLDALRAIDGGDALRLLVPLQVEPIYVVVRREESMAFVHEIADRRINLGAAGTDAAAGGAQLYQRLFDARLPPQRTATLPDAEALHALIDTRDIDVAILVGRAGFGALAAQDRLTPGAFKLLVFDAGSTAGRRALRSYMTMDLPPSPGYGWMDRRLAALGVMSFLVGRGVDDDQAGQVVRTLCQHRGRLRSTGHPYWLSVGFRPVNAPGYRYAAGAERELRACSARWSAASEPIDETPRTLPMVSQAEDAAPDAPR